MANYFDQFEKIELEDDFNINTQQKVKKEKEGSYWDQFEKIDNNPIDDEYNLNFNDPQKKSFSENHPFIASVPEAGKQFVQGVKYSYPEFGKGVNDLVALLGDKTGLEGLSNFGKSNAQFWGEIAEANKRPSQYQGLEGLSNKSTILPTIAGSIGDQATNILTAAGGGAGGARLAGQIGAKGLAKAGLIAAGTSVPNLAQEGSYLDKVQQFQEINGRMPTPEELKQIQNVAIGEKAVNTILETVADRLLFGKLFPEGTATKGLKQIGKNIAQQGVTEAGTEAMQEGVSIGAEKMLGLNNDDLAANLRRVGESAAIGGIVGGTMAGGTSLAAQPYETQFPQNENTNNAVEAIKNVSAQVLSNGKELYNSVNEPTAFDMMRNLSEQGAYTPSIEELAPNTVAKMQSETPAENKAPKKSKKNKIKEIAPNTVEKIENNEALGEQYDKDIDTMQNYDKQISEAIQNEDFETAKNLREERNNFAESLDKYEGQNLQDEDSRKVIEQLAPNTVAKINQESDERVENTEKLQANEIVGQEGNTNNLDVEAIAKERAELLNQDFIKNQRKYIADNRKKGWTQNADNFERELEEYIKNGKNQYEGQHNIDFANDLVNKNYERLISILAQGKGSNEVSKKLFEKYTGVKLPSTIEGKKNAILEWAGKDVEEYNNELKDRYAKKQAEREQAAKDEELKNAINELENTRVKTKSGVILTKRQFIKDLFDSGYELEKTKQGIKPVYQLMKGNSGYNFNSRIERLYIDELYKNGANTAELDAENAAKEEESKQKSIENLPLKDRLIEEGFDKDDISTLLDRLNGENSLGRFSNFAKTILDRTKGKTHIEFKSLYDAYVARRKSLMSDNESDIAKIAPKITAKKELEEKIDRAYNDLKNSKFVPSSQKQAMLDSLKDGEEKEYFANAVEKLNKTIEEAPEIYQTQNTNTNDIKPVLHYFGGTFDLYVTELDKETGEMYGLGGFNNDFEWGYNTVSNFDSPIFNVDLHYDNDQTIGDILGVEKPENIDYNKDKGGANERQEHSDSNGTTGQSEQVGTTPERSENDRGTNVDSGRRNDSGLDSERGQGITPEDSELVNKSYKNQHELNKAIEDYINNDNYSHYGENVPQEIKDWLKKYAGAGGLEKQGAEGKGLLTEYYTPKNIVNKMWDLTKQYVETNGAKVLEPSVGIGRFLENAPENTSFDVVEMNPISAKITKILYPDANVTTGEFQERFIDKEKNLPVKKVNGEYDIVIGNPPYGQYSGRYKGLGEGAKYEQLESYFINRSLDSLKDNGVLTFIVPSSFLRGQKGKLEIANKCELLDAYRLPNNTFDTTSIGTDIIVLRKKSKGTTENKLFGDKWFNEHPEKILGEVQKGKGNWGSDIVKGDKNAVESIDTSKSDKKETVAAAPKVEKDINVPSKKKTTKKNTEVQKAAVEYTEYQPENPVSEEDLKYFADTKVDGTLPKNRYSPNEKVNMYNGDLYNDFNYLQGDIYEKLDALEKENISDAQKEIQRKKLMEVLPKPKELIDINLTPTSDFIREYPVKGMVYDYQTNSDVEGTTYLDKKYLDWVKNLTNSEREGLSYWDIDSFVKGEKVRIKYRGNPSKEEKDNQRAEYMTRLKNAVDKTFNDFLNSELTEEERKDLTDKWNRKFNKLYTPDYKKMPMIVKGLNSKFYGKDLKLQDVQVEGINYLTNKGVGLLGFEVGVGKTLSGTIATVQNMQMGRCKRPLILVPKQVKPNWIREIHEAFPNIKINDLDNLGKFSGEIEDGSISVATFQALDNLWYSPETLVKLKSDVYRTGNDFNIEHKRNSTKRGEEKTKERFEEFIGKAEKGNKKQHTFEELGIDHITVDEAHNFKNLFADAKADGQEGNTYSKITGAESTRAKRMFLATQYILGENNNRNVFMLTATPFNNSPLEVFNMLSYMAKDKLDNMGLYNVYQFMENYVDLTADWVVDSKNNVVYKQIAKGFKNLESLQSVIDSCMLIRSADDAGIKRPNKHTRKVILEPTQEQLRMIAEAEEEAVGIIRDEEGEMISIDDNARNNGAVLKAIAKARKATLSPDIYNDNIEVSPEDFVKNSPKLNYVAQAVESMLKKDPTTSQIIYMPLGVDYLPKLKQYFINKKVLKADEIAIIKSGVEDDKINEITDSFNDENGKIKLIIGTNKIKEGMNLNKNSSVLYVPYMDWNPTDYMQVVGRIWRRGNKYNDIRVVVPLLKDSSDPFMFQKLDEKTSRINNIMDRGKNYIDTGELDTAEEKINMIANPDKKADMFSQIEQQKLNNKKDRLQGQLDTTRYYLRELNNAESSIKNAEERIETLKEEQKGIEDKESWSYRYNQQTIDRYKKQLADSKRDLKLLNARIERYELDFKGKDSEESINKELEKVEEEIKQLKETKEKKRAEYKDEYNKNRNSSKTIEEYIKEFDADTDALYKSESLGLYRGNITNQADDEYKFFLKGKQYKANDIVAYGVDLATHSSYEAVKDFFRGCDDVPIRIADPAVLKKYNAAAYYNKNGVFISEDFDIPLIIHELTHFKDYVKNRGDAFFRIERRIYNAIMKIEPNSKFLYKLQDMLYRNTPQEKIAYHNQDVANKRLQGDKNARFKQVARRTPSIIRGLIQVAKSGGANKESNENRTGFKTVTERETENGRGVFGRRFNGHTNGTLSKETVNKDTSDGIRQAARDKVYEWHNDIESDRYDVDKSLNSFINLTKHKAKDFSKKLGFNVTDTQVREIMPFLRERTELPKNLNRPELTKLYNALSDSEKEELTKLADSVSNKFEKYYKNYQDIKGEQTAESIENHISHIWDLDKKKKSLLTNYITTNSRFAKRRTIGTLIEGIDGFEVNGEKVQFKPKTLDYAEILKISSDNLIKSTHDTILANQIKNLKYKGKPLVLAASKAPEEWIEVNHPALNKAVYMGEVGEKELPLLMKTSVKVHPEIADYVSSIFEVQKNSDFWNMYDALNGMIKQTLLGFSGFHGYALSESSVGNAGVMKTLKELNPKKFVDAIKNGNYDVYKNEEAAKRAIKAGVQLGTPSDLQRNLVEETLKKIPLVGKYVAGAVSANNKILWDVLHNNFKVLAFNTAIENLGGNVSKEQERAVAQWVNDSFGGQAWELLGIKKSSVKAASRILLSPDWNFSTIRQAAAAINSEWADDLLNNSKIGKKVGKLTGIGEEKDTQGARGKIGRDFWLRSALFFTVFYNVLNAAFREWDRDKHPELYPKEMTPIDYSIWSNSYPMDNIYDRIMPKVFIGRNSDGTARMLRVGKQFREVPEFLTEPISKFGGKTAPIINISSQVGLGMSPSDVVNKMLGKEAYLNQDIWNGYGENARRKQGLELAKGRAVALGKSLVPYIGSKYIGGKHEFSAWDFVAQTNAGATKSKVYKQAKAAFENGQPEKIKEIKVHAYKDGLKKADINKMVGFAEKNYKTENTKRYKGQFVTAIENKDKKELNRIKTDMEKHKLSAAEQRRIYQKAWEDYRKSK